MQRAGLQQGRRQVELGLQDPRLRWGRPGQQLVLHQAAHVESPRQSEEASMLLYAADWVLL